VSKPQPSDLPHLALRLAREVPETVVLGVAAALDQHKAGLPASARTQIAADIAQAPNRAAVGRFLTAWSMGSEADHPVIAATALRTATCAVSVHRAESSTELVWTGPNPETLPLRRTDQALLEVIDAAQQTLTIVTFAAYKAQCYGSCSQVQSKVR